MDMMRDWMTKTMEHKIGEIVTLPDGRKAEVVEDAICVACVECFLFNRDCWDFECRAPKRTDHKYIIYKEIKED